MIAHVRFASTVVLTLTVFSVATTAQLQDPQPIPLGQTAKDVQLSRRLSLPGRRIRQIHFSPDGQFLLAQDDLGITVLTVQPLSVLFRVPAENITFSGFTPDSRQVLFLTFRAWVAAAPVVFAGPTAHLERWSVADHVRVESAELPWGACESWGLSPDGHFLACLDSNGTLSFLDVAASATIFRKKTFNDGRFILALPVNAVGSAFAWDLQQKKRVSLPFRLKARLANWGQFAMIASDRLLISRTTFVQRTITATLVAFPSGKVLSKPILPQGPIYRAADPNFVIVRPFEAATDMDLNNPKRSAAVEIRTGQVIVCDSPALDVFGRYYAAERTDGELGLYERGKGLQATVTIPSH